VTSPPSAPPKPDRLIELTWGYAAPLIIETALTLGVFDQLNQGPKTAEEVSAATGASARGMKAVLNALVGLDLLAGDEAGRYLLAPESSHFLVSTNPEFLGAMIRDLGLRLIPKWLHLTDIVRSGKPVRPVNREKIGAAFYQEFVESIVPLSHSGAHAWAETLHFDMGGPAVKVLDLGAGSGVWSIALAQKSPNVLVTAIDWEEVLPATRRMASHCGVADRFRFVAGDLSLTDFGTGYDIVIAGHILHNEGVHRSRALLRKMFEALAPGGTAVVADLLVNDARTGPLPNLLFAVNMLVNTDQGDTFSAADIIEWLSETGFEQPHAVDIPGPSSLLVARKPS